LERARVEAIERERQRIDALVHDQVLHTLLVAARANTVSEQQAARDSAKSAIESLQAALAEHPTAEEVTVSGLLRAISSAAQNLDSRVEVEIDANSHSKIPTDAAQALTEAAIQALDNAIQHSSANSIKLRMFSDKSSQISIVIEDDGVGFRINRVLRDRLGISTSIKFRVESVGGRAEISSSPGKGTVVSLRWGN
jgi:signal transduction histidine kinase